MIVVSGTFRLPVENIIKAQAAMATAIAASRAEPGCRAYSYAEDILEQGLFRVHEEWDSREALDAHFATEHMREWQAAREALGFADRDISIYEIDAITPL